MKKNFTGDLLYRLKILFFLFLYTIIAVLFVLAAFVIRIDSGTGIGGRFAMVRALFSHESEVSDNASLASKLAFSSLPEASANVFGDDTEEPLFTVVIDPGHGGPDPGAYGITGSVEKDINLTVSKMVAGFLGVHGVKVLFTRTEDIWLADDSASHKKQSDVSNRVKFCREHKNDAFISIHMNSFGMESCSGTQVFASPNYEGSTELAKLIQSNVRSSLQPDNTREVKKAGSNIFVLDRIESCAVLIECGFLSNRDEEKMLGDETYLKKLSFVIAESIYGYLLSH